MRKILVATALFATFSASAQRIMKEDGDLAFLKTEKALKIEYVYDGMGVGKYEKEQDYIDYKVGEYNKKEPGKGDKWLQGWKSARKNQYEPKFEELLNKYLGEKDIMAFPSKTNAKYTLILKTTFTEPGFNIGIMRKPAAINVEYIFVETANPSKVVAKLLAKDIPGRDVSGYDFDAGERISEGYAKAGKMLGKYILDYLKK